MRTSPLVFVPSSNIQFFTNFFVIVTEKVETSTIGTALSSKATLVENNCIFLFYVLFMMSITYKLMYRESTS